MRQYQTNVRAPFVLTQALLPMLKARRGQVVFVNSSSGIVAKPMSSQYDSTKHALKAIADSLRGEVNAHGVRVLSVYLGRTASEMQERIHRIEEKPYRPELLLQPEDVASVITERPQPTPHRRGDRHPYKADDQDLSGDPDLRPRRCTHREAMYRIKPIDGIPCNFIQHTVRCLAHSPRASARRRGFFARTFCVEEFAARGLETSYPQHSISYSARKGTLRGMHYQRDPHSEAKLVRCVKGAIWDVIIDIRPGSPTYRSGRI